MQGLVQTFHFLPLLLLLITGRAVALGGKSFFTSQRSDLVHKNYAMLTMCQPQEKVYLNVSLYLNPLQENHHIKFARADMPFEISSDVGNVSQVTIVAAPWPVPLNIRQITFRLGKRLYKLVLNQDCDSDEKFWTAPDMIAYWARFVDCAEMDVFCDARLDEITDCNRLFTYHVFWQNGIDRCE